MIGIVLLESLEKNGYTSLVQTRNLRPLANGRASLHRGRGHGFYCAMFKRLDALQKVPLPSHRLPVGECYTMGKYSRCLSVWRNPSGDFSGFFHHVKIMQTIGGPMREGKREEITLFYGERGHPMGRTPTSGDG